MSTLKPANPTVSFTVNDAEGKLKEGIKHCFLSTLLIDTSNPPATIRANNGTVYQVIYDCFHLPPKHMNRIVEALASFQSWPHGNFVVIRNKNSSKE